MSSIAWPQYSGFNASNLRVLLRFLTSPKQLLPVFGVFALILVYVVGLFIPIPGLSFHAQPFAGTWWFLTFLDLLFTGGALGRGSLFAMGMFAPMILGSKMSRANNIFLGWLRTVVALGAMSCIFVWILRTRGAVGSSVPAFAAAFLWITLGAIALKIIALQMARLHGPSPWYINLFLVLFLDLRAVFAQLMHDRDFAQLVVIAIGLAFIAGCGYFLLNSRVYVPVQNVAGAAARRSATLEFSAIDEALLDSVGTLCITFYICFAALLSIAFGWRFPTEHTYPALIGVSVLAFALVWKIIATAIRVPNFADIVGGPGLFGFTSPRALALRLMNSFWIIPEHQAGPETEAYIKTKMSNALKRSFLTFGVCFVVAVALHYYVSNISRTLLLFPFGPLTSVFIILMLVGNLSMMYRTAILGVSQYRQLLRGRSRLLAGTYLLGASNKSSTLALDAEAQQYWDDERILQQLHEVFEWLKLVQPETQFRFRLKAKAADGKKKLGLEAVDSAPNAKKRVLVRLRTVLHRLVAAVVLSFLVVIPCMLLFPDLSRRDLGLIVVPLFIPIVVAPEMILGWFKRTQRS